MIPIFWSCDGFHGCPLLATNFELKFYLSSFQTPLEDFCLPVTDLQSWFTDDQVRLKRAEIAAIIRNLTIQQFPDNDIQFPPISLSPDSESGYQVSEFGSDEEEEDCFGTGTSGSVSITIGQVKDDLSSGKFFVSVLFIYAKAIFRTNFTPFLK